MLNLAISETNFGGNIVKVIHREEKRTENMPWNQEGVHRVVLKSQGPWNSSAPMKVTTGYFTKIER